MKKDNEEAKDDLELHPWLKRFDKKDPEEQIIVLKEKIKELENNLGTGSILLICFIILVLALMLQAVIIGTIGISNESVNAIIGLIKSKGGHGG